MAMVQDITRVEKKRWTASLLVAVVTGAVALPLTAGAHHTNGIYVDGLVLSRCGPQFVMFTGAAHYGPGPQELRVLVDGFTVLIRADEPILWFTGFIPLAVGGHIVTGRVADLDGRFAAEMSLPFSIQPCPTPPPAPTPTPAPPSSSNGGSGGGGNGSPGPDTPALQPKVKAIKKVLAKRTVDIRPLNRLFRQVFGRNPTVPEWQYWVKRMRTDKPDHGALIGAMRWHGLHGRTLGK